MNQRQSRYRNRKENQGFVRVEVLVPVETVGHLKAYARALRDSRSLGVNPPLFEGMARNLTNDEMISAEENLAPENRVVSQPVKPSAQTVKIQTSQKKQRPDFSRGLLDE